MLRHVIALGRPPEAEIFSLVEDPDPVVGLLSRWRLSLGSVATKTKCETALPALEVVGLLGPLGECEPGLGRSILHAPFGGFLVFSQNLADAVNRFRARPGTCYELTIQRCVERPLDIEDCLPTVLFLGEFTDVSRAGRLKQWRAPAERGQ